MSDILIHPYIKELEEKWDNFVLNKAANGTMLHTRNFLNYHPIGRFVDNSLVILKGNEIIGVVPANLVETDKKRILHSHMGSTFGGLVIDKRNIKVSILECIFEELDQYCLNNRIDEIHLKMTSRLYSKYESELLDYMLFNHSYGCTLEVGYYIDFKSYNDDIASNYSASVRRHYRSSLKNQLLFCETNGREGIAAFYNVLLDNYRKFGTKPVHALEELYLLKDNILRDKIRFFCVFKDNKTVAASMAFDFDHKVFHTQYLASRADYSRFYVNEFLYTNLIQTAKDNKFPYLSFGTATFERGKILNYNLAQYKEQYGTDQYVNRSYHKIYLA